MGDDFSMEKTILQRPWAILAFSLLWGAWMLFVGAIPNITSGRSLESLTFEYRDYLLRMFVVFLLAHLIVRETNFKLLIALPLVTLALQHGLNVYDFSEWYSRTFRVNLHELNAQLFVVPVQLLVLVTGIVFCCRKKLRTTTRIFATIMMAGSLISTLGFHLSIVNITYKPVERVYSASLEALAELDDPSPTCVAMKFDCNTYPFGSIDWEDSYHLDPQMYLARKVLLSQVMGSQMWIRREGVDFWLGLAELDADSLLTYEVPLDISVYEGSMNYVVGAGDCPTNVKILCWDDSEQNPLPEMEEYSVSTLTDVSHNDSFVHVWAHTFDFDGEGLLEPALIAAGRMNGGSLRVALLRLPQSSMDALSRSASTMTCESPLVCNTYAQGDIHEGALPPKLVRLYANRSTYEAPIHTWVDKALSRNPILYINRPEFLRTKSMEKGVVKVFTSPKAFSDITLDIKISFNLIIGLFSSAWLSLGVFLILFHTRRQLLRDIYARERQSATS